MPDTTPNIALPFLFAAQAQKHVTLNESLLRLDALVQLTVLDRDLSAPPGSPADGSRFIIAAGASGAWAGQSAGTIAAWQDSAWIFIVPREGWLAWLADEATMLAWSGTQWISAAAAGPLQNVPLLGVNATANPTNRLVVAAPATLLDNAGAGHQLKINKAGPTDTAALLFQTGFSGRAELGLAGSDDLSLKVSADGSAFSEVFTVNRTTAEATFARGAMRAQIATFTASGTWTRPDWARTVQVILVGGGGGGGSGRRGAEGSSRFGGGGGGGGGLAIEHFLTADLPASMSVDIGAGGTGGAAAAADDTDGTAGGNGGATAFRDGATTYLEAIGGFGGPGGTAIAGSAIPSAHGTQGPSDPGGSALGANAALNGSPSPSLMAFSPGGGGAGGGRTSANVSGSGANGSDGYRAGGASRRAGGGAGSTVNGVLGGPGAVKVWARGVGGGGGGGRHGTAGGTGGAPGGGGGGGGLRINATGAGGAGGAGARGEAWIISRG